MQEDSGNIVKTCEMNKFMKMWGGQKVIKQFKIFFILFIILFSIVIFDHFFNRNIADPRMPGLALCAAIMFTISSMTPLIRVILAMTQHIKQLEERLEIAENKLTE